MLEKLRLNYIGVLPDFEKKALLDLYGDAKKAIQECDMTIAVMGINKSIERKVVIVTILNYLKIRNFLLKKLIS